MASAQEPWPSSLVSAPWSSHHSFCLTRRLYLVESRVRSKTLRISRRARAMSFLLAKPGVPQLIEAFALRSYCEPQLRPAEGARRGTALALCHLDPKR